MIQGGFILIARKLAGSFLMGKPPLWLKLWVWMLLQARFRDGNGLKRGQFLTTIDEMREAMTYQIGYRKKSPTRDQIRNAYENFTKTLMITTTKTTRGMIITILNYDEYQNSKNYETHSEAPDEDTTKPTVAPHVYKGRRSNKREMNEKGIPPNPPTPEYPSWLNQSLWEDFKAHRKAIGRPLKTVKAEQLNLNRLRKLVSQGYSQQEIIDTAIERGWQSLFEPENKGNKKAEQRTRNNLAALAQAKQILFGE